MATNDLRGRRANFGQRTLKRGQLYIKDHSLGMPFLLYPANFSLWLLIYKIVKCLYSFSLLEWIFGRIAVGGNILRIIHGSIVGQSLSMLRTWFFGLFVWFFFLVTGEHSHGTPIFCWLLMPEDTSQTPWTGLHGYLEISLHLSLLTCLPLCLSLSSSFL